LPDKRVQVFEGHHVCMTTTDKYEMFLHFVTWNIEMI